MTQAPPSDSPSARRDAAYADVAALRQRVAELEWVQRELATALSNFLTNPLFQVAVGGNPIVVDAMLASAHAALAKASP